MSATIISFKAKRRSYIVVENAGGDDPRDIREFETLTKASAFIKRWYDEDEFEDLDVMIFQILPNGERTTDL